MLGRFRVLGFRPLVKGCVRAESEKGSIWDVGTVLSPLIGGNQELYPTKQEGSL